MRDEASYRFEPLERRGLLLGLGLGQLVVLAARSSWRPLDWPKPGPGRVVSWPRPALSPSAACLSSGGGAATIPMAQRGGLVRVAAASPGPAPTCRCARPALRLPARTFAPGVYLCELPATNGQTAMGALLDEKTGTAAALLRARGGPFCLLDERDKEHRLAAWADVWSQSRPSAVRWRGCNGAGSALPADSEPLLAHLRSTGDAASPGFGGHALLLERAGKRSWRHETFLVVSVRCRGRHGHRGPTAEGAATLRNQVRAIRAQMRSAGFVCEGVLDAVGAATAIGGFLVAGLDQNPGAFPWPLAVEEHWSEVRAEGCWHRTFWVAEWPRSRVGPDFLSPLLVGTARRSVSVVMAPIPPERAARDAESSRTAEVADAQLRAQGGFLQTARQRRQSEALEGRETELADGRGAFELAGYITVSASDKPGLEEAASELERAAGAAKLSLRPLYGQQKEALGWALPFGRGI